MKQVLGKVLILAIGSILLLTPFFEPRIPTWFIVILILLSGALLVVSIGELFSKKLTPTPTREDGQRARKPSVEDLETGREFFSISKTNLHIIESLSSHSASTLDGPYRVVWELLQANLGLIETAVFYSQGDALEMVTENGSFLFSDFDHEGEYFKGTNPSGSAIHFDFDSGYTTKSLRSFIKLL